MHRLKVLPKSSEVFGGRWRRGDHMRRVRSIVLMGSVFFAACDPPQSQRPVIKIGVVNPADPSIGGSELIFENVYRTAESDIEKAGGVLGSQLQLVIKGVPSNADPAVMVESSKAAATELLEQEGVSVIIGANTSSITLSIAELTIAKGALLLTPQAGSPKLTTLMDNDTVFRIVSSPFTNLDLMGKEVYEQGHRVMGVVYLTEPAGLYLFGSTVFRDGFVAAGGTVPVFTGYTLAASSTPKLDTTDYTMLLQQLYDAGVDGIYLVCRIADGVKFLQDWSANKGGLTNQDMFIGPFALSTDFASAVGVTLAEGMSGGTTMGAAPCENCQQGPHYDAFVNSYTALLGSPPSGTPNLSTATYDTVLLVALAIEKAGSTDPEAIRLALREIANAPGEKVGPADLAHAFELVRAGEDIDFEGAHGGDDLNEAGESEAQMVMVTFQGGVPTVTKMLH